jgi:hypothetical protein
VSGLCGPQMPLTSHVFLQEQEATHHHEQHSVTHRLR